MDNQKKLLIEIMEADEKDGLYKTNNMAQQTALQSFLTALIDLEIGKNFYIKQHQELKDAYEKSRTKEEKMYFEFFKAGQDSMEEGGKSFEQYYNETYGKNN